MSKSILTFCFLLMSFFHFAQGKTNSFKDSLIDKYTWTSMVIAINDDTIFEVSNLLDLHVFDQGLIEGNNCGGYFGEFTLNLDNQHLTLRAKALNSTYGNDPYPLFWNIDSSAKVNRIMYDCEQIFIQDIDLNLFRSLRENYSIYILIDLKNGSYFSKMNRIIEMLNKKDYEEALLLNQDFFINYEYLINLYPFNYYLQQWIQYQQRKIASLKKSEFSKKTKPINLKSWQIGNNYWSKNVMQTKIYQNGDSLLEYSKWKKLNTLQRLETPAYQVNDDLVLYNAVALYDSRPLVPAGWHLATADDYHEALELQYKKDLKSKRQWKKFKQLFLQTGIYIYDENSFCPNIHEDRFLDLDEIYNKENGKFAIPSVIQAYEINFNSSTGYYTLLDGSTYVGFSSFYLVKNK